MWTDVIRKKGKRKKKSFCSIYSEAKEMYAVETKGTWESMEMGLDSGAAGHVQNKEAASNVKTREDAMENTRRTKQHCTDPFRKFGTYLHVKAWRSGAIF